MPYALSNYTEDKLFRNIFLNQSWTPPSTVYLAFYRSTTTGGSTEALETVPIASSAVELTGGGYARVALSGWSYTNDGISVTAKNSSTISFPTATANWNPIFYIAIMDAATGGNVLIWDRIYQSDFVYYTTVTAPSGSTVRIAPGNLRINFSTSALSYRSTSNNFARLNSGMSVYLQDKVFKLILQAQSWSPPSVLYLGLFKEGALPGLRSNNITNEVSGNGYARLAPPLGWDQNGPSNNVISVFLRWNLPYPFYNFPAATADWGEIRYVGIMDAATGGNVLFYGEVTSYKFVTAGTVSVKINLCTVEIE